MISICCEVFEESHKQKYLRNRLARTASGTSSATHGQDLRKIGGRLNPDACLPVSRTTPARFAALLGQMAGRLRDVPSTSIERWQCVGTDQGRRPPAVRYTTPFPPESWSGCLRPPSRHCREWSIHHADESTQTSLISDIRKVHIAPIRFILYECTTVSEIAEIMYLYA
jgi:hypothetical protein